MNESIQIWLSGVGICQGASNKPGQCMRTCRIPMYPRESQDVWISSTFQIDVRRTSHKSLDVAHLFAGGQLYGVHPAEDCQQLSLVRMTWTSLQPFSRFARPQSDPKLSVLWPYLTTPRCISCVSRSDVLISAPATCNIQRTRALSMCPMIFPFVFSIFVVASRLVC